MQPLCSENPENISLETAGHSEDVPINENELRDEGNIEKLDQSDDCRIALVHETELGISLENAENHKSENRGGKNSSRTPKEERISENGGSKEGKRTTGSQPVEDLAPDGGWGWVVVIGASFTLMVVDTIGQCFGIIFSTFLLEKEASSLTTAWMINMFFFFFCLTGLPIGPLLQEFGWRKIAFATSLILTIATVFSAFANSVWSLYFSYSLLAGASCGALLNISYTIVPHYFSRRRGLASGIIMALDSGGQIVAPPLVRILQEEYAFKGATLILGGIVLNCCVAAAVFHPVQWHMKPSAHNSAVKPNGPQVPGKENKQSEDDPNGKQAFFPRLLQSMATNMRIFRYSRAVVIALGSTFFLCGYQNFMAFMPFVVRDAGYSLGDAANFVSLSAVCNMIIRFLVASLSDYSWFSYRYSMMVSCAILTVSMIIFSLLEELRWMMVLMCIYGFGVGSYMCLFNLVMIHYLGIDNLIPMMGSNMMIIAISNITIGPLAGMVRDITGSYVACIWVLASLPFISFLLWLIMPLAVKYDKKKRSRHKR